MSKQSVFHKCFIVGAFLIGSISCGSDIYKVRVNVSGLSDSGTLVLQNNNDDDLTVDNNGPFDFSQKLASGDAYSVTILTQPTGQSCVVSNGSGTIQLTSAANIEVVCDGGGSTLTNKKIFITTSTYSGNLGGISGADAKCMADSAKPTGGGTYKAMIADQVNRISCLNSNCSPANAQDGTDWVFLPNTTYYQADGTTEIGTTNAERIIPFDDLVNGFSNATTQYWTGLGGNWGSVGVNCDEWMDDTAGSTSRVGTANGMDGTLISSMTTLTCDNTRALACVEQ